MDRVINWFTFLHDKIRRTDPNANTHIKLMPHCWSDDERDHGLDFEALTDLTEISGNDAQLYKVKTWENEFWWQSKYAYNWKEMMAITPSRYPSSATAPARRSTPTSPTRDRAGSRRAAR